MFVGFVGRELVGLGLLSTVGITISFEGDGGESGEESARGRQ